ncbi:SPP1 family predicted phage head-tail adaptor [Rhizobium subbaraonis]|uniref:SPP1 family predicted phage head-tail adaptor n=1 Tax=Rhizobium subbaraonis TaxID=908946 RepID=A0A285U2E2_9HYPH|nr:phage head closure protein [Rhizobium subbaraonis]SOC35598.1 SPP1 family predicted phage head-tail adaptor [Rhizobium subbaraonis]
MERVAFDPGVFTARLTLERSVETPDGQGGVSRTYAAFGSAWARIEPVSAGRSAAADAYPMRVTHRIWLRHRGDLTTGVRLRKGARLFDIRTFRDPDESRRYVVCDCEEMER